MLFEGEPPAGSSHCQSSAQSGRGFGPLTHIFLTKGDKAYFFGATFSAHVLVLKREKCGQLVPPMCLPANGKVRTSNGRSNERIETPKAEANSYYELSSC